MRRIRPEPAVADRGFSRWIRPRMNGYLLACCDCNLVHELEFYAVKVTRRWADGRWAGDLLKRKDYRVFFRARRAPRITAKQRAKRARPSTHANP